MIYKNLWISYNGPRTEHVFIGIMKQDMTELEDIPATEFLDYFTGYGFDVETYKYENCREHLGENGLFIDRIPPEIIEQNIKDWHQMQKDFWEKSESRQKEIELYGFKEPVPEDIFRTLKNNGGKKEKILEVIELVENKCYDEKLKKEIQKKHKELLNKYFPES